MTAVLQFLVKLLHLTYDASPPISDDGEFTYDQVTQPRA
jgi:hypothetical protein